MSTYVKCQQITIFSVMKAATGPILIKLYCQLHALTSQLLFCWIVHRKMSFYYPSSHELSCEVVYFLLHYGLWSIDSLTILSNYSLLLTQTKFRCLTMELFSIRRWRLDRPQAESCYVYVKPEKFMQHMHGIIPKLLDCWADPVAHFLLIKSSMARPY